MIPIGQAELELLKDRVELVSFIESFGARLKRTGKLFVGLCPLPGHDEKSPSFQVNPVTKRWICRGNCSVAGRKGGDAIAFLMAREGLRFPEALARLRSLYGVQSDNGNGNGHRTAASRPTTPAAPRPTAPAVPPPLSDLERAKLLELVVGHYERALPKHPRAQQYLKRRGLLVPEVLRAFRVGFADGSLADAVAGDDRERLIALGVLNGDGRETMTGMVVVPMLDLETTAVVNLYGRALTGRRHHYLQGALRGLVNAERARAASHLVVVESVLDALSLVVLGVRDVLALYGTNGFTPDHEALLESSAAKRVTLLLDSDAAGRGAAARLAGELAKRGRFTVCIAELPDHKDPNEALAGGITREALREVLASAMTVAEPPPLEPEPTPAPLPSSSPSSSPSSPPSPSPAPSPAPAPAVEEVEEGLRLSVGPRLYTARALRGGGYLRLDTTLRLEDGRGEHLDRLDLYCARARRAFALQVSRRMGYDEDTVERELNLLAHQGELYLARKAPPSEESRRPQAPELTAEEKAEALTLLQKPDLLDQTLEHLTRLGYVGEPTNKVLGYLVITSRKLEDPLSLLVLSQSAAGKSALAGLLERVTPPEDVEFFSRLTPAALYYMKRDRLFRKVVIIEERPGSEEADYSIRTLQSRKKLVLGVPVKDPRTGQTETRSKEVDGPAVFLQTTTAISINFENATRSFELYLDEGEEQTRRIHSYQRRLATLEGQREAGETEALVRLHWNAQRLLRPLRVVIPYAELLTFPESWLRTRRDQDRFLNLMKASAFLHQYQRESPEGEVIEASVADYSVACHLAAEVLAATLSDLKRPARDLLEAMKALAAERAKSQDQPAERVTISRREVRERTGLPDHQVRRLLHELVSLEHIEQVRGRQGALCLYRVPAGAGGPERLLRGLLTPAELAQRIAEHERRGKN